MSYKPDALPTGDEFHAYVLNEFKKIAAEFLAIQPAPPPSADVLWRWDGASLGPFYEQSKVPGRATIVSVNGVKFARLHTESGDNNVAGSGTAERNDLALPQNLTQGYEGREQWWAHTIIFPDDYVDPPQSNTANGWHFGAVFDFHNTTDGAGQANMQVQAMPATATSPDRPTGLGIQMAWGTQATPQTKYYPVGPISRNTPYSFKYHLRWTSSADGFFDAWVNGVQKMAYRGPTLYAGQGVYLKLANYHTAFGKASSVLHGRVILARTEAGLA